MADEREELLKEQIVQLEEQTVVLAEKLEEVMGISCDFGSCVFDPEINSLEDKLAEVEKRKTNLEGILEHLKSCE